MTANPRNSYPIGESARIRSGKHTIVALHDRACAALSGGACACDVQYKLVRPQGARGR